MEQEPNIYTRKNGENLIDPDIIALCKLEQNRDIIENTRLGSYDKFGNYVFLPDIRFELINIPKFIYHFSQIQGKKVFDIKTTIPLFGELFFTLKISQNEAVLYLVETVTRELGNYVEVYEEVIDALVLSDQTPLRTEDIFAIFHIYENDDDQDKETLFIYDYHNILIRKIYLSLLSKELTEATQEEESDMFFEMISFLKDGGEYGKKVLNIFMARLKERPEIFEIDTSVKYKKAINEVLLSALDVATTPQDKEDINTKKIYLSVLNARNKDVEKHIETAHKKIEKNYVLTVATSAIKDFNLTKLAQSKKAFSTSPLQQAEESNAETIKNKNVVREFYDHLILKNALFKSGIQKKSVKEPVKSAQSAASAKVEASQSTSPIKSTLTSPLAATLSPTPFQKEATSSPRKQMAQSPSSPKPFSPAKQKSANVKQNSSSAKQNSVNKKQNSANAKQNSANAKQNSAKGAQKPPQNLSQNKNKKPAQNQNKNLSSNQNRKSPDKKNAPRNQSQNQSSNNRSFANRNSSSNSSSQKKNPQRKDESPNKTEAKKLPQNSQTSGAAKNKEEKNKGASSTASPKKTGQAPEKKEAAKKQDKKKKPLIIQLSEIGVIGADYHTNQNESSHTPLSAKDSDNKPLSQSPSPSQNKPSPSVQPAQRPTPTLQPSQISTPSAQTSPILTQFNFRIEEISLPSPDEKSGLIFPGEGTSVSESSQIKLSAQIPLQPTNTHTNTPPAQNPAQNSAQNQPKTPTAEEEQSLFQ